MTMVSTVTPVHSRVSRRRAHVGYLVLVALAWFQVAFAGHQFEHVTGDRFDACTVCKHLERHGAGLAPEPAQPEVAAAVPVPVASQVRLTAAGIPRCYDSRAPPSA